MTPDQPADGPKPCTKCGQVDHGQYGEYPCAECGLPTVWDEPKSETYALTGDPVGDHNREAAQEKLNDLIGPKSAEAAVDALLREADEAVARLSAVVRQRQQEQGAGVETVRSRHEQMCWHQAEAARLAQEICGDPMQSISFPAAAPQPPAVKP